MVNETVQYYTENGCKPVYALLLDASKAFDKVAFNVLFNKLRDRFMCPRITKLLYHNVHNSILLCENGVMNTPTDLMYQMV